MAHFLYVASPIKLHTPKPQQQIYHFIDGAVTGLNDEIQFMHKDGRLLTRLLANVLLSDRWSRSFIKSSGRPDILENDPVSYLMFERH